MKKSYPYPILLVALCSCSSETTDMPENPGSTDENIAANVEVTEFNYLPNVPVLSVPNVNLLHTSDSAYIYVNAKEWEISKVLHYNSENEIVQETGSTMFHKKYDYAEEHDWLKIENVNRHLLITAVENQGDSQRMACIVLVAGLQDLRIYVSQQDGIVGKGVDTIKLYPHCIHMGSEGGRAVFSTARFPMGINSVKLDDTKYDLTVSESEALSGKGPYPVIKFGWMTLTREGNNIVCEVEKNNSGKNRTFTIDMHDVNFYTQATCLQFGD